MGFGVQPIASALTHIFAEVFAVAQKPIATSDDVITYLKDQHVAIEAQQDAFTRLRTLLAVHETAEEHDAKVLLSELEDVPCNTAEFTKALVHLQAAVLKHAELEESEEFTLLEQLDAAELEKMAAAVRVAERIAPTHPHAGVESAFVNFAVGPFASMLDRARDALRGNAA